MIRRCFLLVLVSLAGTIASCLLLGIGLYWNGAAVAVAIFFVLAMICLLAGTIHYIREVVVSLSSVQNDSKAAGLHRSYYWLPSPGASSPLYEASRAVISSTSPTWRWRPVERYARLTPAMVSAKS